MTSKPKITVLKVIIFIVIVGGFIALSYYISKAFASTCVEGQIYNDKLQKCVNVCKGRFPDGKGGCRDCKDPKKFKPPGGECQFNCSKYGENSESCGSTCINKEYQTCLPMNIPCDTTRVTYDKKCCPPGTNYTIIPSEIWPDGSPWNDNDDISKMNADIKEAIKDNLKYTIEEKEYIDLQDKLKSYKIIYVKDFVNAPDEIWKSLKLSQTFQDLIRPVLGKPTCGKCVNELCGGKCCSNTEECVGGNICCKKENVKGNKCCEVYSEKDGCCDETSLPFSAPSATSHTK